MSDERPSPSDRSAEEAPPEGFVSPAAGAAHRERIEHDVDAGDAARTASRGAGGLVRRLLVFQFKLLLDGMRDLVLSPVSIGAVLVGILRGGPEPDAYFRRLLRFGRRTDRFIDLFEAHEGEREASGDVDDVANANALIDAVERIVREEVAQGRGLSGVEARVRTLRKRRSPEDRRSEDRGAPDAQ